MQDFSVIRLLGNDQIRAGILRSNHFPVAAAQASAILVFSLPTCEKHAWYSGRPGGALQTAVLQVVHNFHMRQCGLHARKTITHRSGSK